MIIIINYYQVLCGAAGMGGLVVVGGESSAVGMDGLEDDDDEVNCYC